MGEFIRVKTKKATGVLVNLDHVEKIDHIKDEEMNTFRARIWFGPDHYLDVEHPVLEIEQVLTVHKLGKKPEDDGE